MLRWASGGEGVGAVGLRWPGLLKLVEWSYTIAKQNEIKLMEWSHEMEWSLWNGALFLKWRAPK